MNELAVVSTVLGILGTVCAIVFGLATYKRNRKKDDSDEGKQSGTVLTEIGYIKSGIDDIKAEQREQRNTNTQFLERLTAVEASAKQAHKRIDREMLEITSPQDMPEPSRIDRIEENHNHREE